LLFALDSCCKSDNAASNAHATAYMLCSFEISSAKLISPSHLNWATKSQGMNKNVSSYLL
jgi:hypothetical protein